MEATATATTGSVAGESGPAVRPAEMLGYLRCLGTVTSRRSRLLRGRQLQPGLGEIIRSGASCIR
jgi:hypothetical protein